MRKHSIFYTILLLSSFACFNTNAQSGYPCPTNIDVESGTTAGWTATYGGGNDTGGVWFVSPPLDSFKTTITTPYSGFLSGRHVITNSTMGNDPYGGFPMVCPDGGAHSWKLGSDSSSNRAQSLQFLFTIPNGADDYSINFEYAVVLQDAGHRPWEQPRFTISVIDASTGASLKNGCYDLNFVADKNLPGFISGPSSVLYKPWTKSAINLSGSGGKAVIINITSGDCSLGGHFGYGYFDVIGCDSFKVRIVPGACNLDEQGITIKAPEGYMAYDVWNMNYSQHLTTAHTNIFAFHPTSTNLEPYNVILTPFPSVNSCVDTTKTDLIASFGLEVPDSICALATDVIQLNATASGGMGALNYVWTETKASNTLSCYTCTNPIAQTPVTNDYVISVTDGVCTRKDTSTIFINTEGGLDALKDFILCHPGNVDLDVDTINPGPLSPVTCGISTDPPCANPLSVEVRSLHRDILFKIDTSSFVNPFPAMYTSAHMQFLVKKEDMYFYGLKYGQLNSIAFDVTDPGVAGFENFAISLACTNRGSMNGGFSSGTTLVYSSAGGVIPSVGWNSFVFDQPYNWDTAQNLLVDICFNNTVIDSPSAVNRMINTGSNDMYVEYTNTAGGDVCAGSTPDAAKIYVGRPNVKFDYCYSTPAPFKYAWFPGDYISDSSLKNPFVYISKTREIFVKSQVRNGCYVYDSVTITVPVHDYDIYPRDTSVCFNEPFQLNALGTFSSVKWFEYDKATNTFTTPTTLSCGSCDDPNTSTNPIALPTVVDTLGYAVEFTDKDACNDTLYMSVIVRPLPPVKILTPDTIIKYGSELMLLAQGGYVYTWWPTGSISNPNVVNPYVTPVEPTMYYVYGTGENGCRNIDSVYVNIDYNLPVVMPTAFTPNGDNRNDVFRPTTLKFKRLQEFRIFNRWGQEIFSTTDVNGGWDGSWHGQPQDMGVYQYVIKVASPEGKVETFKGDVTLIR